MNPFLKALGHTRIYPLTDTHISGLSHENQVAELSQSGARIIQLREKQLSGGEFFTEAAAAVRTARQCGVTIIVNDRVDIALAVSADGVHLGQDDLPPAAARKILGSDAIIGVSTHNLEQVRLAVMMPVDYVALGPIFPTNTKTSSDIPLGAVAIREARQLLGDIPLVAIGGISGSDAGELFAAGAAAVALISDCWTPHFDAAERRRRSFQL